MPPTQTPVPLASPTVSLTPSPQVTAAYAVIAASSGGGAVVRSDPAGTTIVDTLLNGTMVQVFPEVQTVGGGNWVHIRTPKGIDGWVLQTVLTAATPSPAPTLTLTPAG